MAIGGYSERKKILKSTEYFVLSFNWTRKYDQPSYHSSGKLAEMLTSRSGHACSLLTSDRAKIIVTGDTRSSLSDVRCNVLL